MLVASVAHGQDKPVAYNNLSPGGRTPLDEDAHKALDDRYNIIDFELAKHTYAKPKLIGGSMPDTPKNADGSYLHGYVLMAYVVKLDGRAVSPTIVKCSAPKLCEIAVAATASWRFEVATLDGAKVSTIALQEFEF
jgi:hypothetical protein